MEAVLEMPDDSVAELEAGILEDVVEVDVEREDLPLLDVVPDLPANASAVGRLGVEEASELLVLGEILGQLGPLLVDLADGWPRS